MWPPGHTLAAETRPKPRFRGKVGELGGAFAPPISPGSCTLGFFAYKRPFFVLKMDDQAEIGFRLVFSFLSLGFRFSFSCNFSFHLCNSEEIDFHRRTRMKLELE